MSDSKINYDRASTIAEADMRAVYGLAGIRKSFHQQHGHCVVVENEVISRLLREDFDISKETGSVSCIIEGLSIPVMNGDRLLTL